MLLTPLANGSQACRVCSWACFAAATGAEVAYRSVQLRTDIADLDKVVVLFTTSTNSSHFNMCFEFSAAASTLGGGHPIGAVAHRHCRAHDGDREAPRRTRPGALRLRQREEEVCDALEGVRGKREPSSKSRLKFPQRFYVG